MNEQKNYILNSFSTIDEIIKSMPEGLKLDLGCGYYKPKGYIGIDNLVGASSQIENKENQPDMLMDLNNKSIPFPNESCIEIRSSHFLEHSNLDLIINESFRLLKPNGVFVFTVPYANSAEGMFPGHNIFLTEKWFQENINFQNKFTIKKVIYYPSAYWKALPLIFRMFIPFKFARIFLFNACWQMTIRCVIKKN